MTTSDNSLLKEIDILSENGWLFWSVLAYGIERGWGTFPMVEYFAMKILESNNADNEDYHIALLACGNHYKSLIECNDIICKLAKDEIELQKHTIIKIWEFAYLQAMLEIEDAQEQFNKLQDIIVMFDYPEELYYCDQYHIDGTAPPTDIVKNVLRKMLKYINSQIKK